jgi:hypothetical protein
MATKHKGYGVGYVSVIYINYKATKLGYGEGYVSVIAGVLVTPLTVLGLRIKYRHYRLVDLVVK